MSGAIFSAGPDHQKGTYANRLYIHIIISMSANKKKLFPKPGFFLTIIVLFSGVYLISPYRGIAVQLLSGIIKEGGCSEPGGTAQVTVLS